MSRPKLQPPQGMHDILPDAWKWFNTISTTAQKIASSYGFSRIETPVFEDAELFSKGLGAATDIVEKEIYTLRTKGGDFLAARPEGTAPIARAYISHGMYNWPQPVKLWHLGPMFRHERPQRGRLREFWQFGIETIGEQDAIVDAEIIQLFYVLLRTLGLSEVTVQLNSIGCSHCRPYFVKVLVNFYRSRQEQLCKDCKRRLKVSPLRILDCKEERCIQLRQKAPQFVDHLCEECHNHFKMVLEFLEELKVPYLINFYLVRGLDYYTRTVFEMWSESQVLAGEKDEVRPEQETSQAALASGGRYDDLIKKLGGKPTPGCGGAMGLERVMGQLLALQKTPPVSPLPRVFLTQLGMLAKKRSLKLFEDLRRAGIESVSSLGRDSIKSQLKLADRIGVEYVLIFGQQEAIENAIIVREMKTGQQQTIRLDALIPFLKERLRKK